MNVCSTPQEDIKRMKRNCWNPSCHRRAFIRDWKGWKWCLGCWWRQFEYKSLEHWLIELKTLRIF